MHKIKMLLLFFSLFFIFIFSTNVHAYTEFNYNSVFNSTTHYWILFDTASQDATCYVLGFIPYSCSNMTMAWNYTIENKSFGTGSNNKMIFRYQNNNISWNYLTLIPITSDTIYHDFNYTTLSSIINSYLGGFYVPANEELLYSIRYRVNNTVQNDSSVFLSITRSPNLYTNASSYLLTSYDAKNFTNYTKNGIIPASSIGYWYFPSLTFMQSASTTMINDSTIEIDRFKFYTYDGIFNTIEWDTETNMRKKYCGNLSSSDNQNSANVFYSGTDVGFVFGIGEETFPQGLGNCAVYKINNTILTRRINSTSTQDASWHQNYCVGTIFTYSIFISRNAVFMQRLNAITDSGQCTATLHARLLMTSLDLQKTEITIMGYNASTDTFLIFNGGNKPNITLSNSTDGLIKQLHSGYRETKNLSGYINTSVPAGDKFKYYIGSTAYSDWIPFYSTPFSCSPRMECSVESNSEQYILPNCSVAYTHYCGACGCRLDLSSCNYPSAYTLGTFCDISGIGYTITLSDCSVTYNTCGEGNICQQFSTINESIPHIYTDNSTLNTIACIKQNDNSMQFCIDTLGNQISCSDLIANLTISSNPLANITCPFGIVSSEYKCYSYLSFQGISLSIFYRLLGTNDIGITNSMLSLLISLTVSTAIIVYLSLNQKGEAHLGQIFLGSFIGTLFFFTIGNLFNLLFFIALFILDLSIMSGMLQKLIGGHDG